MAPAYGIAAGTGYITCASTAVTNITITSTPSQWVNIYGGTAGSSIIYNYDHGTALDSWQGPTRESLDLKDGKLVVPKGRDLLLPDGTVLHIDDLGNVRLDDSQAKVIYQANRMREFNPYVNASDLLASFIRFLGTLGLSRGDAGQIQLALFVNWLVIEAAKADNDPIPDDVVPVEAHPAILKLLPAKAAA